MQLRSTSSAPLPWAAVGRQDPMADGPVALGESAPAVRPDSRLQKLAMRDGPPTVPPSQGSFSDQANREGHFKCRVEAELPATSRPPSNSGRPRARGAQEDDIPHGVDRGRRIHSFSPGITMAGFRQSSRRRELVRRGPSEYMLLLDHARAGRRDRPARGSRMRLSQSGRPLPGLRPHAASCRQTSLSRRRFAGECCVRRDEQVRVPGHDSR
jgi:hypothetical protein